MKFAICGAGYIAEVHARAIQSIPDCSLSALVVRPSEKAIVFADKYSIPGLYADIEEMIQKEKVDAVIICTPNFLHAPQTLSALQAGIPVMVEKPMAANAAEAKSMHDYSLKSGIPLMVAHCWRFDPEVLWLKKQVEAQELGKIIRTKGYSVHTNWGPSGWFAIKKYAAGGAMADMGIHAIDTTRFLLGDPLPLSVYSQIGTYYIDADVDDTGVVIIKWDNGVVSYIESGWWQPHSDGVEASTQLYGIKGFGSLFPTRLELPEPSFERVEVLDPGFSFPCNNHMPQSMYNRQMAYFVDCIKTGRLPIPGGLEGWINMKIVDAAYQSALTNQVINM